MAKHALEKRPLGALGRMGVVAGFHAALIFILASSFGLMPKTKLPPDIHLVPIDDRPQVDEPPPPVPYIPTANDPVVLPTPDVPPIAADPEQTAISADLVPVEDLPGATGSALPVPELLPVRADPRHPLTQPRYPPELIREGAQGAVDIEVYVQPNGRVADARIFKSSGFDAFDRVTLDEARRNWRLSPATRDGQPFAQWYRLRVVFKLKNQQ